MTACRICGKESLNLVLNAGAQPICNRFRRTADEPEFNYALKLGQCPRCAQLQLIEPPTAPKVVPPYDWIAYNEPESHLDDLVRILAGLPGLSANDLIAGISYKEDSTLARFNQKGFANTWRLEAAVDLGLNNPCAGLESIQDRLSPEIAAAIAKKRGRAKVLIARHILEHAHDTKRLVAALKQLVLPDGYLVFEVPDSQHSLNLCDPTVLWEEHILYFTPDSYQRCFALLGLELVRYECFHYPTENSLVAIVRPQPGSEPASPAGDNLKAEFKLASLFAAEIPARQSKIQRFLTDFRAKRGQIALFGAGHLSCTFLRMTGVEPLIECLVDDHPKKQGLYLPGTRLPVKSSQELQNPDLRLCLLSLSPESENRVINKHPDFTDRGGMFLSIFPGKITSLPV